jgi:hypothetical protein
MEMETIKDKVEDKVGNYNRARKEGKVARAIESQTSRLPSDLFLWTSLATMAAALTFKILKKDHEALFVGQWAAPFLLLGIYNKIVKEHGHDNASKRKPSSI